MIGGSVHFASSSGSSVALNSFTGSNIVWISTYSPGAGMAQVTLDNNSPVLVNLAHPDAEGVTAWSSSLDSTVAHKIVISYDASSPPTSHVDFDCFQIAPPVISSSTSSSSPAPVVASTPEAANTPVVASTASTSTSTSTTSQTPSQV